MLENDRYNNLITSESHTDKLDQTNINTDDVKTQNNKQSGSRTPQRKKKEKKKGDKNRSQTLFRFIEDKVLQKNLSIVGM